MSTTNIKTLPHQKEIGQMAKGTMWVGAGDLIANALYYISSILITRTIGAPLYGLYFLGNTIILIGSMVSRLGLDFALLRFVALFKGLTDRQQIAQTINSSLFLSTLFSIVVMIIIFMIAPWLSNSIFKKPELTYMLRIFAFSLPFINIISLTINAFLGIQSPKLKIYIENLLQPLTKIVLIILFFIVGLRLTGVVIATVLSTIIVAVLSYFLLHRKFPELKKSGSLSDTKPLLTFAMPVFWENLLNYFINWIDTLLLGYFATAKDVGVFGIIFRLSMVLVFVQYAFNAIFSPMISELSGKHELKKLEQLFKLQTRWAITLTLPLLFVMICYRSPILNIFGEHFSDGATALLIMSSGRFFDAGVGASGLVIMMIGKPKINTINSLFILILKIILNFVLIPRHGLIGAAIASSVSIVILDVLRVIEVYFLLKIHPYNHKIVKPVIATGAGLVVYLMLSYALGMVIAQIGIIVLTASSFMLTYCIMLYILNLDDEDMYLLQRLYQKITLSRQKIA